MDSKINDLREFEGFVLDARKHVLWFQSKPVNLALKEIELLCALTEKGGEVVSKSDLLAAVWADSFVEESNLARHIYIIRKTFKGLGVSAELIETVPRRGYRFAGAVSEIEPDALVIEKRTLTETTIEIETETTDAPDLLKTETERRFGRRVFASPRLRLALPAAGVLLVFLTGLAFYRSQNSANKTFAAASVRSIAVLPFRSVNSKPKDAQQGLGLADVLITRLSNIREISVRPTSAIAGFENQDSRQAGVKLGVDAVLEGTIYRSGERVRVTARLLRTDGGAPVWTAEFEKSAHDEIALQNEIAAQVVGALALNLSGDERNALAKQYTESADALRLYQKGRYEWSKRDPRSMVEAERLFREAIKVDPQFALAYVGLADTLGMFNNASEGFSAAGKALEIDPNLAEAHASRGLIQMFHEWRWRKPKWDEAEASFRRAVELNPNYTPARQWLATLLMIRGRLPEAETELRRALEINPLSHNLYSDLCQAQYYARNYAEAEKSCLESLELMPDFAFANYNLIAIYLKTGNYEKWLALNEKLDKYVMDVQNKSEEAKRRDELAYEARRTAFKQGGGEAVIRLFLEGYESDPNATYSAAQLHAILGERGKAFDKLERSYEMKAFNFVWFKVDPQLDNLRDEPRYRELLRKMDLETSVQIF